MTHTQTRGGGVAFNSSTRDITHVIIMTQHFELVPLRINTTRRWGRGRPVPTSTRIFEHHDTRHSWMLSLSLLDYSPLVNGDEDDDA